jgi:hypothetical protein
MRNKLATFAASVPLMLAAAGASGGDLLQYQTPTTDRAHETQSLLNLAAHAVHDRLGVTAGGRVSNLWVFPTGDDHAVFVQYTVTTEQTTSKGAASQVHLELLRIQDDRIVEERDLTRSGYENTLSAQQAEIGAKSALRADVAGS